MGRRIITIIFILIFTAGLSTLLYPVISDYINSKTQTRAVSQYNKDLQDMNEEDYTGLFETAYAYNERLNSKANRFMMSEEEREEYRGMLNVGGRGAVMATLEIVPIEVKIPIHHGSSESVLQSGLGHLEGSSLPVGGPGTHSVITGHRGLPSATLLTNLDRMSPGDTFDIHVLNTTLTYMVDQILIVEPDEINPLLIVPGEDYCTLVTCTPYGINSHRLLVRGRRAEGVNSHKWEDIFFAPAEAVEIKPELVTMAMMLPAAGALMIRVLFKCRKYKTHCAAQVLPYRLTY